MYYNASQKASFQLLILPLQESYTVTVNGLETFLSVCLTSLYCKNWTHLDFHIWHVYTPPKWQERALTDICSTILEAIKKGKKAAKCGFFQSSRLFLHLTNHEFYITSCLNDSSFQQSKLKTLNMYTSYKADKSFMKHPAHNYSTN